jgi:hypothetical protein
MARLALVLAAAVALLLAFDACIPRILGGSVAGEIINARRDDHFRHLVRLRFEELRVGTSAFVSRIHRGWSAIPDQKRPEELRIFLIGNSTVLFAVVPQLIEEQIAADHPDRDVSVMLLGFPTIRVPDEQVLVRAAIAKQADVIVICANAPGLVDRRVPQSDHIRELFGGQADRSRSLRPAVLLDHFFLRHWNLYRSREELRNLIVRQLTSRGPFAGARAREVEALQASFRAIADAADTGDMDRLVATYEQHQMLGLVTNEAFGVRLSRTAPGFSIVERTAAEVRESGAVGVAIFVPMNPIFRDAEATRGHEELYIDDAYLRDLADHTLELYRKAGFVTANRIDLLKPSAFIDPVHVNAEGMRIVTDDVAAIVRANLEGV